MVVATRRAKQRGGRSSSRATKSRRTRGSRTIRSATAKTPIHRETVPIVQEQTLTPREQKLKKLFMRMPPSGINAFLQSGVLTAREKGILRMARRIMSTRSNKNVSAQVV